ncbi:Zn-dependent alcohol dehydrogenase [Chloroflexota bacterium]
MKAAVCYEAGKPLIIEDVDIEPPRKDQVTVRLAATAICHSDISQLKGDWNLAFPIVGGHESAGYVEEVGEDVTTVNPGDHVVVSGLVYCGKCFYCCTGAGYLCANRTKLPRFRQLRNKRGERIINGPAGTFAEYTIVHYSQVTPIPKDMPMDSAALLGCSFITGFGAVVNTAEVRPLNSVVIIGLGGVGFSTLQGAVVSGANPIIAVDIMNKKLELSRAFGAMHTINPAEEDAIDAVKSLTFGRGADYVFVTVGNSAACAQGVRMSREGGTTVMSGVPPSRDTLNLSLAELVSSSRRLITSMMGSTIMSVDIPRLVAYYQAGRIKLDELISGRYPLEQINEAIASTETGEALRNVIVF